MSKKITQNQQTGEIGEAAARFQFLSIGFQFDVRSRLEAGIDAIVEIMIDGQPTAKMIAVQIKSTKEGKYPSESETGFTYRLRFDDLRYWKGSNLPVIIVLYRQTDNSFYWKDVRFGKGLSEQHLAFDKQLDRLDRSSIDRIAALTVPKQGHGYYVPPLGDGENAIVNILPLSFPEEIFIATTPYSGKRAVSILHDSEETSRFDWLIYESAFWSFHDPRNEVTRKIVELDKVEAIDTSSISAHESLNIQNQFSYLLRLILAHQFQEDLRWSKEKRIFYFAADKVNPSQPDREFHYSGWKKGTSAHVVSSYKQKDSEKISYVRHHAFSPKFERIGNQWCLIVNPTYFFTYDGFSPHSYPHALLSGKKRNENNASLRGQVIMWQRFLSQNQNCHDTGELFDNSKVRVLEFSAPPVVELPTSVPETAWRSMKAKDQDNSQGKLDFDAI